MKFGQTKEARGGDGIASGCEFFKRSIGKHILKHPRIIAALLARSRHRKAAGGSCADGVVGFLVGCDGRIDGGS
jgi:hypothetical protein